MNMEHYNYFLHVISKKLMNHATGKPFSIYTMKKIVSNYPYICATILALGM